MNQLSCRQCGAALAADAVDFRRGLARCEHCNVLYDLSARRGAAVEVEGTTIDAPARARVPMPAGMTMEETARGLVIARRWFTPATIFLLFFCIAWDSFLIFWYGMALTNDDAPWLMIVFPIAHVAVGVGLTYRVLCGFVEKTEIRVDRGTLSVRHVPLPWPGNRELATADVDQLYAREVTRTNKGRTYYRYELHAMLTSGERVKLLEGLEEQDQALFLEQEIEAQLGIRDRPVAGEVPR